jgi:iron complex outermembrane recepter protein
LCCRKTRGATTKRAEIIPNEPDAGNADEGRGNVKRTQRRIPRWACRFNQFKTMLHFTKVAACIMLSTSAWAQQFSISGTVRDAGTKQLLTGATVQTQGSNGMAISNERGAFRIEKLTAGSYILEVTFLGYATHQQKLELTEDLVLDIALPPSYQLTDEVVIRATRATEDSPTTFQNIDKQTIEKQNFGQDLPFVLNWTPSLVTTSDAGAGVGYTGVRIRGSDATRINVTINGIPYNDSESQGTFWVNMPDIASSTQSIQIQRGVGTSTNGGSAFGASINLETTTVSKEPFAEATLGGGSFNTQRYTFKTGTGLINNTWAFEARASQINSDGYVDRASSDLRSFFLSGGYYGTKTIVKAVAFGGYEKTYQAYYGVDKATLETNRTLNYAGALYDDSFNIVSYYDNQVDNYRQDHYQLHIAQHVSDAWTASLAFHYTYGRGFYEQYLQSKPFSEIGLENLVIGSDTLTNSDMIEKRWLDNDFYGTTFSLQKETDRYNITIGGAYNSYTDAKHFGEIIWAQFAQTPIRNRYYEGESEKNDFNVFTKLSYQLSNSLHAFIDLQYRTVHYQTAGVDNDLTDYSIEDTFHFFNPKAGVTYQASDRSVFYASYAIANREPNRSDYLDGLDKPKREHLRNIEVGWRRKAGRYSIEANYYWMRYKDQLVLTGEINDVGAPIRANSGESYRTGLELSATISLLPQLSLNANITGSLNENKNYAIDNGGAIVKKNTSIILSPNLIAGSQLSWLPTPKAQLSLLTKYVGRQYLDNTENKDRKLDAYFVNDLRMSYELTTKPLKAVVLSLLVNNVFNVEYSSNGYVFDSTPYFFPQAGTNLLAMVSLKF